jgi:hypothetical protein
MPAPAAEQSADASARWRVPDRCRSPTTRAGARSLSADGSGRRGRTRRCGRTTSCTCGTSTAGGARGGARRAAGVLRRWPLGRVQRVAAIAEIDKLEKDKKPVPRRAELMNLETGEKVGWDDVASFEFSKGSSHLAVKKNRPEPKPKHEGADLILRDLRRAWTS